MNDHSANEEDRNPDRTRAHIAQWWHAHGEDESTDNEEEDMMTDETSDITNENGTAIDNGSENETNNEN